MLFALTTAAHAWSHTGYVWAEEDLPVRVEWAGAPDGWTTDEVRALLSEVMAAWADGTCTSFGVEFVEVEVTRRVPGDRINSLMFGDFDNEVDVGVPSAAYTTPGTGSVEVGGTTFRYMGDVDIVLDTEANAFVTDEAAEASECVDAYALRGVLLHEIGHLAGLSHTCEEGEGDCSASELDAVMSWEFPTCSTSWGQLTGEEVGGMQGLYGTPISYACPADPDDPMAVSCTLSSPTGGDLAKATWDFGDGTAPVVATSVTHVFAEGGAHDVELCVELPDCGTPICMTARVYAVAPGTVTGETPDEDGEGEKGGCGGGGSGAALVLLGSLRRRPRA